MIACALPIDIEDENFQFATACALSCSEQDLAAKSILVSETSDWHLQLDLAIARSLSSVGASNRQGASRDHSARVHPYSRPAVSNHVSSKSPNLEGKTSATCTICLCDIGYVAARSLPCCHAFHKDCIDLWLKEKRQCPICQRDPDKRIAKPKTKVGRKGKVKNARSRAQSSARQRIGN